MCGIVGIISNKKIDIPKMISRTLKDLEYRGYDSAGIAFTNQEDADFKIIKCLGAPSENLNETHIEKMFGDRVLSSSGIGHNRWATHGKPSIKNAHPHASNNEEIVVVHNGTILNFSEIKNRLEKIGYIFKTETDTEVIPNLIDMFLKEGLDFYSSLKKTALLLEGSFSVVALYKKEPHKMFAVKNGSPLCFSEGKDFFVLASSPGALFRYSNFFISMDDGEILVLDSKSMKHELTSWHGENRLNKKMKKIEGIEEKDLEKGDFETFMEKEIHEQSATIKTTILGRYNLETGDAVLGGVIDYIDRLRDIKHIDIIGCGTAFHAGMLGKELIESISKIPTSTKVSSEFLYSKNPYKKEESCVLAISQSGETADTLEAVKEANKSGYLTLGITNVVSSAIAEETKSGIYTRAGSEIGVASTKAFTAQCSVLYLLSVLLGRTRGNLSVTDGRNIIESLEKIPDAVKKILEEKKEKIIKLSEKYQNHKVIFLGKGIHMPIAYETALKYKELVYRDCSAYPVGELKHGPIALIDEETVCFVIMPKDELYSITKNTVEQIKAKGGNVVIITSQDTSEDPINLKADDIIFLPHLENPIVYPLLETIPLQLFVYHTAKILGRNIDKPRNLAKSVTVQ